MSGTRWVLLDDAHPSITYGGGWSVLNDSLINNGTSGPAYLQSQHTTTGAASLSFTFTGTRIRLLGTSAVASVTDPSWECFVDGESIGREEPFAQTQNNWPLCLAPTLPDGQHTLTLNVTSSGSTFYFDQIRYLPSSIIKSSLDNPTVIIEQSDPIVRYSGDWMNLNNSANSTADTSASLDMTFTGTKLSWVGWIPEGSSGDAGGSYSVDGGQSIAFGIPGPLNPETQPGSLFFQTLFETSPMPAGEHNISVFYRGPSRSTPLALDHFLIDGGDILFPGPPIDDTPDSAIPSPTKTAGPSNSSPVPLPLGAIIGAVLGGLALIILFILAILFIRRRMKHNLPPIPFRTTSQPIIGKKPPPRFKFGNRISFAEGLVKQREPSFEQPVLVVHTKNPSLDSTSPIAGIPGYIPVYSNYRDLANDDPAMTQKRNSMMGLNSMQGTKLTPLRRHQVVSVIQEEP
ncbi:hypothetical protein FA15DRAFT_663694 [Coprinopsis marcescibilis]|uniref:Uncharacterized protein n=1 Tax=Coprinopsis marcescibilis TaxID=230819 RepID=A0A5C3LBX2_COPMA|nr:hypothetical protein FA15DRAFT_663694 [Coprinopsis marcescibilis]